MQLGKKKQKHLDIFAGFEGGDHDFNSATYKWESAHDSQEEGEKTLYGICRMCMQGDCATKVHLEDGVVVKVEGRDVTLQP